MTQFITLLSFINYSFVPNAIAKDLLNPAHTQSSSGSKGGIPSNIQNLMEQKIGRVLSVSGEVYIDGRIAHNGAEVHLGSEVITYGGNAKIAFGSSNIVTADAETKFTVVALKSQNPQSSNVEIGTKLERGKLKGIKSDEAAARAEKVTVVTDGGTFVVGGGRYMVDVPTEANQKVKFMSLDQSSNVALLKPSQVLNEYFAGQALGSEKGGEKTISSRFAFLSDVDGGDSVIKVKGKSRLPASAAAEAKVAKSFDKEKGTALSGEPAQPRKNSGGSLMDPSQIVAPEGKKGGFNGEKHEKKEGGGSSSPSPNKNDRTSKNDGDKPEKQEKSDKQERKPEPSGEKEEKTEKKDKSEK